MTIGEIIKLQIDAMPARTQRRALSLLNKLQKPRRMGAQQKEKTAAVPVQEEVYVPKDPALRAIAGMWKDRTDLPKDPVLAVKAIRARMRSRGRRDV